MKKLWRLVVCTSAVVCAATVHAQTAELAAGHAAAAPQEKKINLPQNQVVRYWAGDSIPLGFAPDTHKDQAPETTPAEPSQVVRYSAGDSIPLGFPQTMHKDMPVETRPAIIAPAHTKVVRYSAGDSILLGSSAPVPISGRVEVPAAAQKKSAGYSAGSKIPLAAALGDSVSTHIGISQAGLSEANGLINTTPAGLVGLFVVKAGMVYYLQHQKPAVRTAGLQMAAGVWSGFTMNNLLLIAGSTNPASLLGGALFGAYMYHREGMALEQEAAASTAQGLHLQAR